MLSRLRIGAILLVSGFAGLPACSINVSETGLDYRRWSDSRSQGARESDRQDILAELRSYYRDLSDRDWEDFQDHFWPGATLTTVWKPPGEPEANVVATTVPEFVEQAPAGPGSREIFEEWMTDHDMILSKDLAQVWASYRARFGDPGDVEEWSGVDAFTLVKHDGRWKITSLAYSSDR